jgi:hypothetical protein
MRKVDYFGSLLNEKVSPYSLSFFRDNAIDQTKRGIYRLYIIEDNYAVAKVLNGKILDYTVIDNVYDYKEVYTHSKDSDDVRRQAIYHGTCILEGYGLGYDL